MKKMNSDIFEGKWKQMKGKAKEWWGELTDDDLTRIEGSQDKLVGTLQERYGYTKERAEQEIERRVRTSFNRVAHGGGCRHVRVLGVVRIPGCARRLALLIG